VKTFFRALWFALPILVMMVCVFLAFYVFVQLRMHR
jgi:hypothetical protein